MSYLDLKKAECPSNTTDIELRIANTKISVLENCLSFSERAYEDLAERYKARVQELKIYGGHIPPCPKSPCECGFKTVWDGL